ncbi:CoA pyrophosphatase [Clostridium sartagoforme]|uniref:CoA pyrophosphatase n=1 Tax=Clostridium sartagoforme TaxID=84031 RepID=A0A4S2DT25_9CLOT|nr:CoA pyrophosphatase [Clostridium sartagoforme]TGY44181.1 CoA pyrophosphatase [Clostridium sartagoforme]
MLKNIINKYSNNSAYINGWKEMKRASVIIFLAEIDSEINVLFQMRSKKMRSQPGDISFPGGKIEEGEDPKEAAIRETCEEIGLNKCDFEIISPLNILTTHYNLLIHPYLGYIKDITKIKISRDEVDHIFFVPLEYFIDNEPLIINSEMVVKRNEDFPYERINGGKNYKFKNGLYKSLFYKYNDYNIWGITAIMLNDFINDLKDKKVVF